MAAPPEAPTRLARRLGTADAVTIGLGSMLGAGVFAAIGPAASVAGNALLVGLVVAGAVAFANARSSARLAAVFPRSGGAYVYGRECLGPFWGFLAGWGFVVGKVASCSAMAMTFAAHAWPARARPLAVAAVLAATALGWRGVEKTAAVTRILVALVIVALGACVAAIWLGGAASSAGLWPLTDVGPYAVLQSAGLLFFAFAGYARVATLGEEVVEPARTIPRAISIALGVALGVYLVVAVSALAGAGPSALASASAPLAEAIERGRHAWASPVVRIGASIASLSVLLSLLAGLSRTVFAMAAQGDLPKPLEAVHPRHEVPHRAALFVGLAVAGLTTFADVRGAIGFSSFAVLVYYAIANASAWTLPGRGWGRRVAAGGGLAGCLLLAFTLPAGSVVAGAGALVAGVAVYVAKRAQGGRGGGPREPASNAPARRARLD